MKASNEHYPARGHICSLPGSGKLSTASVAEVLYWDRDNRSGMLRGRDGATTQKSVQD